MLATKVMAVNSHELWSRGFYDVIVFSTKGTRSLASMLSGGDYDGQVNNLVKSDILIDSFIL